MREAGCLAAGAIPPCTEVQGISHKLMTQEKVQRLNYCAHAIEDLRKFSTEIKGRMPSSIPKLEGIIELLELSQKFIMPNCCELIAPDKVSQTHFDLLKLPFDVVSFEAPWISESMQSFPQNNISTKRIALCWNVNGEFQGLPMLKHLLDDFKDGGVFVYSVYWDDPSSRWLPANGGYFVQTDSVLKSVNEDELDSVGKSVLKRLVRHKLVKSGSKGFEGRAVPLFPEFSGMPSNSEQLLHNIIMDTRDEVSMLIQACSVMNCENVHCEELVAAKGLNRKRASKGKQPFFSYNVLQLNNVGKDSRSDRVGTSGRTVRTHLRRGHLRRTSKVTWIAPTVVSPNGPGFVGKDYLV